MIKLIEASVENVRETLERMVACGLAYRVRQETGKFAYKLTKRGMQASDAEIEALVADSKPQVVREFIVRLREDAMKDPPEMTDAEKMRRRMTLGVLRGTHDRLRGKEASIPIGIDPKTGDLRTEMPVIKVLPPKHIDEGEDNISDLHDYDDLDSQVDAAAARGGA